MAHLFRRIRARVLGATTWVLVVFFKGLTASGQFRKKNPSSFDSILGFVSLVAAVWLWHFVVSWLPPAAENETTRHLIYEVMRVVVSALFFFVVWLFFSALVPLLSYTPHALAMRSLGLVRCATKAGDMDRLLRIALKEHPPTERVRVICISGTSLFRDFIVDGHAPLLKLAMDGKLDVVMPNTDPVNPTVVARWNAYGKDFRRARYPKFGDLISEIEASRVFLTDAANIVTSHSALCFWQVVLLRNQCLVQSYFPNASGESIDRAPVFLFERESHPPKGDEIAFVTHSHSYYETFEAMFELLKKLSAGELNQAAENG